MPGEMYYTLVASLPKLVHFERAEWVPLSHKQIHERFSMLVEEDAAQLRLAEGLLRWQRQPITRTNEQMQIGYRMTMQRATNESLREFIDYRMNQRTALVALRRRARGLGPPAQGEIWGVGPYVRRIQGALDRDDLGLGALFPWIDRARALLAEKNAVELERLMMDVAWQRLSRIADAHPFRFEAVFAFFFKWDIVKRWLSHDPAAATTRFQELLSEVTRDHQQPFA